MKYRVLTNAITGDRGDGKTTTLAAFATYYRLKGNPATLNIPIKGCEFVEDARDVIKHPGFTGLDEAYAVIDNRMAMSALNRVMTYEIFQQRKYGHGEYVNRLFMCLPARLSQLDLIDVRFRILFNFEVMPKYYEDEDMLVIIIQNVKTKQWVSKVVRAVHARGFFDIFDTWTHVEPTNLPSKLSAFGEKTLTMDKYVGGA